MVVLQTGIGSRGPEATLPDRNSSATCSASVGLDSWTCPAVSSTVSGVPWPSVTSQILDACSRDAHTKQHTLTGGSSLTERAIDSAPRSNSVSGG